jgi:hypothetical protein
LKLLDSVWNWAYQIISWKIPASKCHFVSGIDSWIVCIMEFATFLSAVKRKERTDQYLILSALFFLKAHKTPITSADIQKLLTLRLKKEVPKNIPDALRKYQAYVECVDKGPFSGSLIASGF